MSRISSVVSLSGCTFAWVVCVCVCEREYPTVLKVHGAVVRKEEQTWEPARVCYKYVPVFVRKSDCFL